MPRASTQQADLLHRSSMTYDHCPYKNYIIITKMAIVPSAPCSAVAPSFLARPDAGRIHRLLWGYAISPAAQTKLLTTRCVYHLTVSIGQEPGQESSAQGLTGLQSRCWPGWGFIRDSVLIQVHVVVGGNQFPAAIGLRSPLSYWLSAEGCSQPLDTTH